VVWILVLVVYAAPANAVDWDGPWKFGMTHVVDTRYASEAECRNSAVEMIGRLHQGMLAPIRFRCVEVPAGLPKGAPR
jgi:hypothetical protein